MKTLRFLFYCSILTVFACKGKKTEIAMDTTNAMISSHAVIQEDGDITPYRLNEDYLVIDTGQYGNEGPMSGGSYAIVNKGKFTDTIDKGYGMQELKSHKFLYQKLSHEESSYIKQENHLMALYPDSYIIVDNGVKTPLKSLTKNFNDYFSAPWVINGKIYYWNLGSSNPDSGLRVSAAEFEPSINGHKSYFIKNDFVDTDDSNYFGYPFLVKDTIYFYFGENDAKKFSTDFKPYN